MYICMYTQTLACMHAHTYNTYTFMCTCAHLHTCRVSKLVASITLQTALSFFDW